MPFAMFIPGWNSLDSVRRVHSDLEFVGLVFFALLVLFEVLAFLEKEHTKKTLLEKIGLWFFAVAVLAELIGYPYGQRNDTLSERIIGSLDIKAQRAADNASKAVTDSSTALSQAKDALTKAGAADLASGKAMNAAGDAQDKVGKVANRADALKDDIAAERKELSEIRAARYIPDPAKFISALRPFAGTKYLFWTIAQDSDSLRIARFLNDLLKMAGWTKLPLPLQKGYDPLAMNWFGASDPAEYIPPERITTGIRIFIASPVVGDGEQRSLASLWKVWGDNPPSSAKPAEALARDLTDGLFPHERTDWGGLTDEEKALGYRPFQVMVVSGHGTGDTDVIAISVGAKPL